MRKKLLLKYSSLIWNIDYGAIFFPELKVSLT